jgi:uncharacterized membrane protein
MVVEQEVRSVFPEVREVATGAPLQWLARGVADLKACPGPSLFYGLCFAGMGFVLNFVFNHAYQYTSALASGFMLVGPFMAIGLYELSRRRAQGEPCALVPTLAIWKKNAANIGVYSLILMVIFLVWARASLVIFALFYSSEMPTLKGFIEQVLSFQNVEFLMAYFAAGLLFAALVFASSVVSIPLMMDRNQDTITSVITSFIALTRNFPAMLLWAVLIVLLIGIGFATLYLGLIVAVPLVGHATWHAYREIVE